VLQRINAEAVAVGKRYPVLVAGGEIAQRVIVIEIEVAEVLEVGSLVLGIRGLRVSGAEGSLAGSIIAVLILELLRPKPASGSLPIPADALPDPSSELPKL
jgi:hypothetical protein